MTVRLRFDTVTCLSDLGWRDESVGLVHSILHDHCGPLTVVDLCHHIDPGDTKSAALMLARSVPHLTPGVVLVSVGRRLDRPAIAVEVGDGQAVLVGPDNGVLAAAVATVGGADSAVRLAPADSAANPAPAAVHPARDVLAPAAARICAGEPLDSIGEPIDPALLLPSMVTLPRFDEADGTLVAEVLSVDNHGVAQLNIDRAALAQVVAPTEPLTVVFGDDRRLATLALPDYLLPDYQATEPSLAAALPLATEPSLAAALPSPAPVAASVASANAADAPLQSTPVAIGPSLASADPASSDPASTMSAPERNPFTTSVVQSANGLHNPAPGRLLLTDDIHAMIEVLVGGNETAADIGLVVGTEVRLRAAE